MRTVRNPVEDREKDDGMRERNRIANGGGRSRMSRHVSQKAQVVVVTVRQGQGGGWKSHDPASGPGGGCHKPSSDHRSARWGDGKERRA